MPPTSFTTVVHRLWLWIDFMVVNGGWVIKGSGDGLSAYNNSGTLPAANVFTATTPYGTGANALGNTRAWIRLAMPSGKEICIQYIANSATQLWVRIKFTSSTYTNVASYTASSTVVPTTPVLADDNVLVGTGTDASPTAKAIDSAESSISVVSCKMIARVENASPYRWWVAIPGSAGASVVRSIIFMDYLTNVSASDTDPYVLHSYNNNSLVTNPATYLSVGSVAADANTLGKMNTTYVGLPAWYPCMQLAAGTTISVVGALGSNEADNLVTCFRPRYGLYSGAASPNGEKGIGTLWSWKTSNIQGVVSTLTRSDKIAIGDLVFDWNGTDVYF